MEWKIGEIFEYNGEWYQCVVAIDGCRECSFRAQYYCTRHSECFSDVRSDGISVIFKKLEKVGEPIIYMSRIFQKLKSPDTKQCKYCYFGNQVCDPQLCGEESFLVEIKQIKEDMEEKNLNLKPFDIQKAREGKPVCTRDGRKARIICFDRKFYHDGYNYPIVAMVNDNDNELVHAYTQDGLLVGNMEGDLDLMMLPEKKEGWVNVYKGGLLDTKSYPTKKEAFDKACPEGYVDTVKICWEE